MSNLKRVISYSMENVSTVQAEFRSSKNENEAMNEVKEKVELAMAEMPQSIERPLIQKTNIADAPVLSIVMSGNRSGKELYDLADNKLRNLFTRINGVTKVNIIGGGSVKSRYSQICGVPPNGLRSHSGGRSHSGCQYETARRHLRL